MTFRQMDTSEFNGMSSCVAQPRLIPHVISEHAKNTPQRIWGSLPRHPSDASQGYEDITFVRFNYAISRAATWLVKKVVPQKSRTFEALAYLGPPDSRYIIFTVAAIKVGFQVGHIYPFSYLLTNHSSLMLLLDVISVTKEQRRSAVFHT